MEFHPSQTGADHGAVLLSPGCTRSVQTVVCPLETPSTALRIGPRGERTLRPPRPCVDDDDDDPGVYHLDVLGRLAPSLQARPPTPGLESPGRLVADVWLSCSKRVCRQDHVGREHPPTLHNGMCEGHQGPDRDGVLQPHVSPHHLT